MALFYFNLPYLISPILIQCIITVINLIRNQYIKEGVIKPIFSKLPK